MENVSIILSDDYKSLPSHPITGIPFQTSMAISMISCHCSAHLDNRISTGVGMGQVKVKKHG